MPTNNYNKIKEIYKNTTNEIDVLLSKYVDDSTKKLFVYKINKIISNCIGETQTCSAFEIKNSILDGWNKCKKYRNGTSDCFIKIYYAFDKFINNYLK